MLAHMQKMKKEEKIEFFALFFDKISLANEITNLLTKIQLCH